MTAKLSKPSSSWALSFVLAVSVGCAGGLTDSPRSVLRAYASALSEGKADEAYALLSEDARRGLSREQFRSIVQQNRQEAIELGRTLARPSDEPYVTAIVPLPSGEQLTMVLEDGRWRVDASALDFYSQATPKLAMSGFIRAFTRKRWDVLIKYTPDNHRESLTVETLKGAWAEDKPEGKQLQKKLEEIRAALPSAAFEETGDRATMSYGQAGIVTFVRERGAWKLEDLR